MQNSNFAPNGTHCFTITLNAVVVRGLQFLLSLKMQSNMVMSQDLYSSLIMSAVMMMDAKCYTTCMWGYCQNNYPLISVSLTYVFSWLLLLSLPSAFGSLPCLAQTCPCNVKSTSCIDLSMSEPGPRTSSRPRILLKAPTLAEMEEMNIFEVRPSRSTNTEILELEEGLLGITVVVS